MAMPFTFLVFHFIVFSLIALVQCLDDFRFWQCSFLLLFAAAAQFVASRGRARLTRDGTGQQASWGQVSSESSGTSLCELRIQCLSDNFGVLSDHTTTIVG